MGLKTKQYVQCLETAPTSQAPHCGLHTAGAQEMLLAHSLHLTVCSPISLLSLRLPHLRLPTHPSLSTYVGPGAQPGVEKGPSPACQPFTAQLGEPDKLPDRLQREKKVRAACARLPWEPRGGPMNTQMRAAPDICACLSASQRHGCERWGRARDSFPSPPGPKFRAGSYKGVLEYS